MGGHTVVCRANVAYGTAHELRIVFAFLKDGQKKEKKNMQQKTKCDPQSLKYLLSGLL